MEVFLLWHIHRLDDDADEKLIGVYSTDDLARDASVLLASKPGFADHPALLVDDGEGDGGFFIASYTVDRDQWAEGFVTLTNDD